MLCTFSDSVSDSVSDSISDSVSDSATDSNFSDPLHNGSCGKRILVKDNSYHGRMGHRPNHYLECWSNQLHRWQLVCALIIAPQPLLLTLKTIHLKVKTS